MNVHLASTNKERKIMPPTRIKVHYLAESGRGSKRTTFKDISKKLTRNYHISMIT